MFPSYETDAFVLNKAETEIIKDELVCFHSKRTFQEDCLGFGISYHKNIKTGDIQEYERAPSAGKPRSNSLLT